MKKILCLIVSVLLFQVTVFAAPYNCAGALGNTVRTLLAINNLFSKEQNTYSLENGIVYKNGSEYDVSKLVCTKKYHIEKLYKNKLLYVDESAGDGNFREDFDLYALNLDSNENVLVDSWVYIIGGVYLHNVKRSDNLYFYNHYRDHTSGHGFEFAALNLDTFEIEYTDVMLWLDAMWIDDVAYAAVRQLNDTIAIVSKKFGGEFNTIAVLKDKFEYDRPYYSLYTDGEYIYYSDGVIKCKTAIETGEVIYSLTEDETNTLIMRDIIENKVIWMHSKLAYLQAVSEISNNFEVTDVQTGKITLKAKNDFNRSDIPEKLELSEYDGGGIKIDINVNFVSDDQLEINIPMLGGYYRYLVTNIVYEQL